MTENELTTEQLKEFRIIYAGHGAHADNDRPIMEMFREFERRGLLTSKPSHFEGMTLFELTNAGIALGKTLMKRRDL